MASTAPVEVGASAASTPPAQHAASSGSKYEHVANVHELEEAAGCQLNVRLASGRNLLLVLTVRSGKKSVAALDHACYRKTGFVVTALSPNANVGMHMNT